MAHAEIQNLHGRPCLVVDGESMPPMAWMGNLGRLGPECLGRPEYNAALWEAGIRVFFLPATARTEDWPQTVAAVERLLQTCPRAFLIFRVNQSNMPAEWLQAHPDELFQFSNGSCDVATGDFMDWVSKHPEEGWITAAEREAFFQPGFERPWFNAAVRVQRLPSFASEPWRAAVEADLCAFIERVRNSAFAERLIGYFQAVGYWEWFVARASIDYSPAMQAAFRRWLEVRYDNEIQALQDAWHDESVSFGTASLPTQAEFARPGAGSFYVPGTQQCVIDYFHCHNECVADTINRMARCIKKTAGQQQLAGFCYGYTMSTHYALTGHSALRKILDSPAVDFIESCVPYEGRPAGNDHPLPTVVESLKAHGKLFWFEADVRTHRYRDKLSGINYGSPVTEAETVAIMTREFAHYLIAGVHAYWFDQPARYYDDPALVRLLRRFQALGRVADRYPLGRTADIALFIDEDSFFPVAQDVSIQVLHRQRIQELGRIGAPYDVWLLEDVCRDDLPDYRFCVFPNAFSLDGDERREIRDRLCRDGRHILWHYAPGLIRPDRQTLAAANMADLTGMTFTTVPGRQHLELTLTGEPGWIATGMAKGFTFGDFRDPITTGDGIDLDGRQSIRPPPVHAEPAFAVTDPAAAVAGCYTWGEKLAGMAVKSMGDWCSIYTGTLCLPHELLANMAVHAGVHRFSDPGDVVYANDRFLAIHARAGGARTIRLRAACDVIDALSGTVVARNADKFETNIGERHTALFFLGAEADWPESLRCAWNRTP